MKLFKTSIISFRVAMYSLLALAALAGISSKQAIACLLFSSFFAVATAEGISNKEVYSRGIKITYSDSPKTYYFWLTFLAMASIAFFGISLWFLTK